MSRIPLGSGLMSSFGPTYNITIEPWDMALDGSVLWMCQATFGEGSMEAMGKDPVDALIDMLRGMSE